MDWLTSSKWNKSLLSLSKYKFKLCNEINMAISSSEIRKNISDLSLIRTKLDGNIYDYIIKNKLYR